MHPMMTTKQVCTFTTLSRTTVFRLERLGQFPKRITLSSSRIAYRREEIEAWIRSRRETAN